MKSTMFSLSVLGLPTDYRAHRLSSEAQIRYPDFMADTQRQAFNSGSRWQRWDPHVHAPGTVLNDQFGGAKSWDASRCD